MSNLHLAARPEGAQTGWCFLDEKLGLGRVTPKTLEKPHYEGMGRFALDVIFFAPPDLVRPFAHSFPSGDGFIYLDRTLEDPAALARLVERAAGMYELYTG